MDEQARSTVERNTFGKLDDGAALALFTLSNIKGTVAKVCEYGATLTELWVPDRAGQKADVVLGFDDLNGYLGLHPYFGGIIGRYANRISNGRFTLDGKVYSLPINSPPNTLHGGKIGFSRRVWKGEALTKERGAAVRLRYISKDGEENFPGNLSVTVVYALSDDDALEIEYTAETDRATPINLTNHSYFNLAGGGDVLAYSLYINAESYTPVDSALIPTGEIAPVANTPVDFTRPATIGSRMAAFKIAVGYDINYVLSGEAGELKLAGRMDDPVSGRELEMWTTEPGVQFYSANKLDGSLTGKRGAVYRQYGAVCLEAQHFPDSVNHPNFPSVILRPGSVYRQRTIYKFSAK